MDHKCIKLFAAKNVYFEEQWFSTLIVSGTTNCLVEFMHICNERKSLLIETIYWCFKLVYNDK